MNARMRNGRSTRRRKLRAGSPEVLRLSRSR